MFPLRYPPASFFFFFNDTATTEIYTLSLHDALPISRHHVYRPRDEDLQLEHPHGDEHGDGPLVLARRRARRRERSEEHTSELQSLAYLVCRLLLEKKKKKNICRSQHKRHTTRPYQPT